MPSRRKMLVAAALLGALACRKTDDKSRLIGGEPAGGSATPAAVIAVVPKGATHEHWKTVHAGAIKAAREDGAEVLWKAPVREDDLKSQIDIVESLIARRVGGICLAPLNDRGLVGVVRAAGAAHIPVVVMDSGLQDDSFVSFVATDNHAGGAIGGERLAAALGGKGRVVMLRYQAGSESTARREQGFLDAIARHPEIRIVSDNQYAGATIETAFKGSENLLAAVKAGTGGIDGIFTPNESATFGMLLALRKSGLAGKIKLVGFDRSAKLLAALADREIEALVVQNPFEMGYRSVKTVLAHLHGRPVERRIDTGVVLVTRENLASDAINQLVRPDLKPWLGEE